MPTPVSAMRGLTAIVVACWLGVASAAAGPFSSLVVFGDSLSDVGNIASATLGIYPGSTYYNDRFSNGPVWVEALSVDLGLGTIQRSTAGGNDFAYGGAQTTGTLANDGDGACDPGRAGASVAARARAVEFARIDRSDGGMAGAAGWRVTSATASGRPPLTSRGF